MVTRIVDESPGFKSLMLPSFLAEEPCNTHELTYEKKKDREGRKEKKGGREKEKKRDRERDRTRGKEKRYDRIEDEAHERQERMEKIRDDAQILVALRSRGTLFTLHLVVQPRAMLTQQCDTMRCSGALTAVYRSGTGRRYLQTCETHFYHGIYGICVEGRFGSRSD